MALDTVSILDGSTFVVSDRRGDLDATPVDNHGLFLEDTRFLSRWILTIGGIRPKTLSVDEQAYFKVRFFEALTTGTVYVDSHLSVVRRRCITNGFEEEIELVNHAKEPVELDVRLEMEADFADLFEVKDKLEKVGERYQKVEGGALTLGYRRETFVRETIIKADQKGEIREDGFSFKVKIAPQSLWKVTFDVSARGRRADLQDLERPKRNARASDDPELERGLKSWIDAAPTLVASWDPLKQIYRRSLIDLAALRFETGIAPGALPAAGLPWFMAVFGRDSLLTSFQALTFAPELAASTLRTLALLQGRADDPFRDEEPGKILHEIRLGEMTAFEDRPQSPYYGAADSTMLFLILLEEYDRWTGDHALARELERESRAAVAWIDQYGDRDKDGYVEYERRAKTGLDNQCWKDSWDSIAFADGTLAPTPRATCELQGYVYDAKRRISRLARDVWGDPEWADKLEREAGELKRRFNEDFWIPERGFFALALDGQKRKVDSLTSNIGHLLWSGIADDDKAQSCVRHLMSEELFSGWGIRTMASSEGSYNPIGYHVGTVWPHDSSFVAWGLRRYGYHAEAARICRAILEAAELFQGRLPEAFGGYARSDTNYPVEYPTACSPQAWATGAPLLVLRTLLGLDSDGKHMIIDPAIPQPLGRIELLDVPGVWGRMDAFGRARSSTE